MISAVVFKSVRVEFVDNLEVEWLAFLGVDWLAFPLTDDDCNCGFLVYFGKIGVLMDGTISLLVPTAELVNVVVSGGSASMGEMFKVDGVTKDVFSFLSSRVI